jgi:hypothetical protein
MPPGTQLLILLLVRSAVAIQGPCILMMEVHRCGVAVMPALVELLRASMG